MGFLSSSEGSGLRNRYYKGIMGVRFGDCFGVMFEKLPVLLVFGI